MDDEPDHRQRIHAQDIAVSAAFLLAFTFGLVSRAHAQIEVLKPLHLSHVYGIVTDNSGRPIANAEVSLVREKSVVFTTKTDDSGRFALDKGSGRYLFKYQRLVTNQLSAR